jgi:hypothetical protein
VLQLGNYFNAGMDIKRKQKIISDARTFWDNEHLLEAGKLIFESIPVELRHVWAASILEFAYAHFPAVPEIDAILEYARNPDKWSVGKESKYLAARQLVNAVNLHDNSLFELATQVGKVVYTAQQYPTPFDHSAGWQIAVALKRLAEQIIDPGLEERAWSILCNQSLLELETPVMCHPGCPLCWQNGLVHEGQT